MTIATPANFKDAMSRFPSGVTIVSTTDNAGRHWGFTASSFSSLSMDPPLVLVCLANKAESYQAFMGATHFAINLLSNEQKEIAMHFARKNADKFSGNAFVYGAGNEPPHLPDSMAALICRAHAPHIAGDHTILIGEVEKVHIGSDEPLVYFNREFWQLTAEAAETA